MARRPNQNKWIVALTGLFSLIVAFIVGGLFIGGSTTGNVVLKYVPAPVHPLVGWAIVIGAGVLGIMGGYKLVRKLI